jgi:DNA-binding response OmpR family regulator
LREILSTKPYLARELIARIRPVLRGGGDDDAEISDGNYLAAQGI